jgi:rod shape-determining protein MreC
MHSFYLSIAKKRDHLLFIFLTVFSLNTLLNNDSPNSLLVRAKFLDSFSFISSPTMWIKTIIHLEEETQLLREKNLQLTLQSDEMIRSYQENINLKKLLEYKRKSSYDLVASKILNMGSSSNLSSITINVGSEDGITENLPVIIPEGLIGKTILAGKKTALVQLISDVNYRASVRIFPSGSVGILRFLYDDICEIREVQKNALINLGDGVFTSGFSNIYPPNLKIGSVIEIQEEIGSFQKIVKVRISSKIGSLLNVFVIRGRNSE